MPESESQNLYVSMQQRDRRDACNPKLRAFVVPTSYQEDNIYKINYIIKLKMIMMIKLLTDEKYELTRHWKICFFVDIMLDSYRV